MKRFTFICLLLPTLGLAQSGERYLNASASMLAANRSVQQQPRFFFTGKPPKGQLDTLSASAQNFHFRAFSYVWQQDYEQAVFWLEKTTQQYQKENGSVGETYLSTFRDYPRALAHFDVYDALTPGFDDIIRHNPVSYLRGLAYRGLGDQTKAIEQFSIAIDSLTAKHGAEWVNYRHFVSRAVSYMAINQPEKALIDLDKAAKNFGRSALVQYQRSRALLQLDRVAEARTALQDASFFYKSLRTERAGDFLEDEFNPVYEPEIDEALDNLKTQTR